MKPKLNLILTVIAIMASHILATAQLTQIGNYSGNLPKITWNSTTQLERDVNLNVQGKTITGKINFKCEFLEMGEYINTIYVNLKGDGIDIQTTTVSTKTETSLEGSFVKQTYIFDVYAGTINGQQINGYFGKAFNDRIFGSVNIGTSEMYVVKKSKINSYQLSYGDQTISYESKNGMNKQGHPKITYAMAFNDKAFEGIINLNGDLKNNRNDFQYEMSNTELSNSELSIWLFLIFSSEVFSGRTEVKR